MRSESSARKSEAVLHNISLHDLPVLGTLVLVYAIERIAAMKEHAELLDAVTGRAHDMDWLALYTYYATAVAALLATIIPILNKTYFNLKPETQPPSPTVVWMARQAKNMLWASVLLCMLSIALQTRTTTAFVATAIVIVASVVVIMLYRREFASFVPPG